MKIRILAIITLAGLLGIGTSFAQNCTGTGPRGQGRGYGGPAQSAEERAARVAACQEKNGGVCPQAGICTADQKTMGRGNGRCNGLRDGTGPRSLNGTCQLGKTRQQRGRRQ